MSFLQRGDDELFVQLTAPRFCQLPSAPKFAGCFKARLIFSGIGEPAMNSSDRVNYVVNDGEAGRFPRRRQSGGVRRGGTEPGNRRGGGGRGRDTVEKSDFVSRGHGLAAAQTQHADSLIPFETTCTKRDRGQSTHPRCLQTVMWNYRWLLTPRGYCIYCPPPRSVHCLFQYRNLCPARPIFTQ